MFAVYAQWNEWGDWDVSRCSKGACGMMRVAKRTCPDTTGTDVQGCIGDFFKRELCDGQDAC